MKNFAFWGFFISFSPMTFAAAPVVEGEFLVKLKGRPQVHKSQAFVAKTRGQFRLKATYGELGMHHLKAQAGENPAQLFEQLKNDPDVEYVEPNYLISLSLPQNTEEPPQAMSTSSENTYTQSYVPQIQVTESWRHLSPTKQQDPEKGKDPVIVAVIDSGVDYNHPLLVNKGAIWENEMEKVAASSSSSYLNNQDDDGNGYPDDIRGWNFVENNNDPMDTDVDPVKGHGTHVAGIIVGVTQPIESDEPSRVKIMPLKFLDSSGKGPTSNAISAIYYAVRNGARIINMSWGGPIYSQALHEALAYAYRRGVLLVAAAGNSARNNDLEPMYPANFPIPSQITVAASTSFDNLASFSNFGTGRVHVAAPGSFVRSLKVVTHATKPGYFHSLSGTSMAAPFVSGLAAMVLFEKPELNHIQVRQLILNSASQLSYLASMIQQGARVQALQTILNAKNASLMGSLSIPDYVPVEPQYAGRSVASERQGGCGSVSTTVFSRWMSQWNDRLFSAHPVAWLVVLSLLPIVVWQILRVRAAVQAHLRRRRHERFIMNSDIKVKVGDQELIAHLNTISVGGVSFSTEQMIDKGGLVSMQITSPDGSQSFEVCGRIVWSEANKAYGVQFVEEKHEVLTWKPYLKKAS